MLTKTGCAGARAPSCHRYQVHVVPGITPGQTRLREGAAGGGDAADTRKSAASDNGDGLPAGEEEAGVKSWSDSSPHQRGRAAAAGDSGSRSVAHACVRVCVVHTIYSVK